MTTSVVHELVQLLAELGVGVTTIKPIQGRVSKLTRDNVERLFSANATQPQSTFNFVREGTPKYSISFTLSSEDIKGKRTSIQAYLPWSPFAEDASLATKLASGIGTRLYPIDILFARIHSFADLVAARDVNHDMWVPAQICEVYWLNWYGNALVERIGRERVRSVPCHSLVELPDGSILWTTRPTPADYASDEARAAQARAIAHLTGTSYDDTFARLRARSEALAPVEPAWDADLDPVYRAILTSTGPADQPGYVRRWNAYVAPPVDDWRASAEVASDVPEPELAIEDYDMAAEHLIALLHDKIDGIGRFSPDTLPMIDAYFYRANYPARFDRADIDADLVPALGAYVGEVLRRRLGGRWVPRENQDEAAVVIGERAWLPFARARRFFQAREGAIDASMTRLYRAAERDPR
jgi:hypothetical protein